MDQGTQFTSNLVKAMVQQYKIKHRLSSPYHPQEIGQVESTNKVLDSILTKSMAKHHKDQSDRMAEEIWLYRTTWKNTTGYNPYELVYGRQALLPIEFQIKTFRTAGKICMNLTEAQQKRLNQIDELDEMK